MKKYLTKAPIILLIWAISTHKPLQAQGWQTNWQSVSNLERMKFFDENNGYISNSTSPLSQVVLLKTTSGGADWSTISFDSTSRIQALDFLTPGYGFVATSSSESFGPSAIRKTTDGGQSWSRTNKSVFEGLRKIKIINQQLIYAISQSLFHKSTNGGTSWTIIHNIPPFTNFNSNHDMKFVDANNGFILINNAILKTTDGGQNWQNPPLGTASANPPRFFDFFNTTHGCIVGDSGLVMRTTNGGASWARQSLASDVAFRGIQFSDINNGYLVGARDQLSTSPVGLIYRTTDGAQSWQQQFSDNMPSIITSVAIAGSAVYASSRGVSDTQNHQRRCRLEQA